MDDGKEKQKVGVFHLVIKPGIPIYEQVVYAVKKAVVSGELRKGDRFPSARELSRTLRINPNTAQKAISSLVQERLLEVMPGIGTTVCGLSLASDNERNEMLGRELERLIVEAKRLGISKEELFKAIEGNWEAIGKK